MARADRIMRSIESEYFQIFSSPLSLYLTQWRSEYEQAPASTEGRTPQRAVASAHHSAWRGATELTRRKYGVAFLPGTDELEYSLYRQAIEIVAPEEWRAMFRHRPPPDFMTTYLGEQRRPLWTADLDDTHPLDDL